MCYHIPMFYRTGTFGTGRAPCRGCLEFILILSSIHNTNTDRRRAMSHWSTPPVNKTGTTDYTVQKFQVYICNRGPHCRTVLQTGTINPENHLLRSSLSWNTRQDFFKIPSLWEATLETERRCFSKVILESIVTQYVKVVRPPQRSSGWLGMHCA